MHTGVLWISLIFTFFVGDVLRMEQAVATELAQAGGNSDAARRQAEEAQRRQADEQRRQAEEAQRRQADEQRRHAEEAQRRQAEEQRRHAEDAQRRQAEEAQRRQAEEQRRHAEDAQRRQAGEAERRQAEEQRRHAEDAQRRQAGEAERRQAEEQRRHAEDAQRRQAGEAQRRQGEEQPAEGAQPRQAGKAQRRQGEEQPPEGAQPRQAGEAQRRQAEERRRQAEEEEILRTRYGCIIAERLWDSRYRLVCGTRSVIVRCSTIECPEAGVELSRLEQEEPQRQEEEALLRVHGCKIIARLGGFRQFRLACGEHRITVVCSTLECPEAGAALRQLSADAGRIKDEHHPRAEGSAVVSTKVNLRG